MYTLSNNVATFVVDRTGVTASSGVYTINYDADLYKNTRKLLEEGYTVIFKVVLKNSAKVNTKAEYFRAYLDDVGTKIYFLPDAELSSAGAFKFTLLDIPDQVKKNKSDISGLDSRTDALEEGHIADEKVYYKEFRFTETISGGNAGFIKSNTIDIGVEGYTPISIVLNQVSNALFSIICYRDYYENQEEQTNVYVRLYRESATNTEYTVNFGFTVVYKNSTAFDNLGE